jgi:hypothetical protein
LLVDIVAVARIDLNALHAYEKRGVVRHVDDVLEFAIDCPLSEGHHVSNVHLNLVIGVGFILMGLEEFSVDIDGANWRARAVG